MDKVTLICNTPESMPDLPGLHYFKVLEQIHKMLNPKTYLEIGVNSGLSFILSRCASIGIDPGFIMTDPAVFTEIMKKPYSMFFNMPSDMFFRNHNPSLLFGQPVDFAFLDGMHRCEFLLRDFINTEAHCRPNSIIALHDCLPPDAGITARVIGQRRSPLSHRFDWWAGDVWRTALLLKRYRPDLKMTVLDAAPTGLVLITNLDPNNKKLYEDYSDCVTKMMSWSLDEIGVAALFNEMQVAPTSSIENNEQLTAHFYL